MEDTERRRHANRRREEGSEQQNEREENEEERERKEEGEEEEEEPEEVRRRWMMRHDGVGPDGGGMSEDASTSAGGTLAWGLNTYSLPRLLMERQLGSRVPFTGGRTKKRSYKWINNDSDRSPLKDPEIYAREDYAHDSFKGALFPFNLQRPRIRQFYNQVYKALHVYPSSAPLSHGQTDTRKDEHTRLLPHCIAARRCHSSFRAMLQHEAFVGALGVSKLMRGHRGCVHSVVCEDHAGVLLSGSDDATVRTWNCVTGKSLGAMDSAHVHNIFNVCPIPNSNARKCVTTGADGQVRVCDIERRTSIGLDWIEGMGMSSAFIEDRGPSFLTTFSDGCLRWYDMRMETSGIFTHIPFVGLSDIAFSPREPNVFVLGCDDIFVRCYDIRMNAFRSTVRSNSHLARSTSREPLVPHFHSRQRLNMYETYDTCQNVKPLAMYAPSVMLSWKRNHPSSARQGPAYNWAECDGVSGVAINDSGELLITYRGGPAFRFDMLSLKSGRSSDDVVPPMHVSRRAGRAWGKMADTIYAEPLSEYAGHQNTETFLKGISFVFGDSCVAHGSDTGFVHVWEKRSGEPLAALKADNAIVNCVASHKSLPLMYTVGISATIKQWSPILDCKGVRDINTKDVRIPVEVNSDDMDSIDSEHLWDPYRDITSSPSSESDISTSDTAGTNSSESDDSESERDNSELESDEILSDTSPVCG